MNAPRSYAMRARADTVAETRGRILRAALDLSEEKMTIEITLDDVATRAGTTVRTVLRHFDSRQGLLDAAIAKGIGEVIEERTAPAGDLDAAIRIIVDHYERRGDFVLRLLAQDADARVRSVVEPGRALHQRWVETVFGSRLDAHRPAEREALVDLLVVASDVYTWKLLRRDRGLDRPTTEARMRGLVEKILPQC